MTEPTPIYTTTVAKARQDHIVDELNRLGAAVEKMKKCDNGFYARYATEWRKMTEQQQNAFYANVRDFRLRLEALTCVEEVA